MTVITRPGNHLDAPPGVISVVIVNDYEIVVRGVAAMLAPFQDRVKVVELDADRGVSAEADVALFDTFAGRRHMLERAREVVRSGKVAHVVLYTWDATPEFIRAARDVGVSGVILKTRSAEALVESLERIVLGEPVGLEPASAGARAVQLSDREAEVLALIARGLTNAQIADELYLSIETVKTYVKRLYAKLAVHNRAQAAVAAWTHRLTPRPG